MYRTLTVLSSMGLLAPFLVVIDAGEEEPDAGLELPRGPLEGRVARTIRVALERRIGDAPMDRGGRAGELGADLAHPIAQRDHVVEPSPGQRVDVLRPLGADVDAPLLHDADRVRVHRLRVAARA